MSTLPSKSKREYLIERLLYVEDTLWRMSSDSRKCLDTLREVDGKLFRDVAWLIEQGTRYLLSAEDFIYKHNTHLTLTKPQKNENKNI